MKKTIWLALICVLAALTLAACSSGPKEYVDGTYTAQSEMYEAEEEGEGDGYGVVTLTLSGGKITACEFVTYQPDGTIKDEEYGKAVNGEVGNADFYNKAQKAVKAAPVYAEQLVETGDLSKVDAISGATYNYQQFKDAVDTALHQAEKK